jgi:hypothetical protein
MLVQFGLEYFLIIPQYFANDHGNLFCLKVQNKIEDVKWSELPCLAVLIIKKINVLKDLHILLKTPKVAKACSMSKL